MRTATDYNVLVVRVLAETTAVAASALSPNGQRPIASMDQVTTLRAIFILGIFQGLVGLLILLSCRCFGGFKLGAKFMKNPAFRSFYKYHCWLWWPFWLSVLAHAILAVGLTGWPF